MEEQWLRNLARARRGRNGWSLPSPTPSTPGAAALKLQNILVNLYQKSLEASKLYNCMRQHDKPLRLIPLYDNHTKALLGFIMIRANHQLRVIKKESALHIKSIKSNQIAPQSALLAAITLKFDLFGASSITIGSRTTTEDEILRNLFIAIHQESAR